VSPGVRGPAGGWPGTALLALLALASCAKSSRTPDVTAATPGTPVDSATVALWRLDETGGTRAVDAGPSGLDATAGLETRTIFGRFRGARLFTRSNDSFVYVPYAPALGTPSALTVEAWVNPGAYSPYEASPIAVRWSPVTAERSWMFAIVGSNLPEALWPSDLGQGSGPLWLQEFVRDAAEGRLMFVYQPADAGTARAYYSQSRIPLERWTHVAVSFDGQVVRFWLDGQPDGTFASSAGIRASQAPLLVGNFFDTRFLSDFGGDLRQGPASDPKPWYAFEGGIDELRISKVARTQFPLHGGR
jgi:hypothetical protein